MRVAAKIGTTLSLSIVALGVTIVSSAPPRAAAWEVPNGQTTEVATGFAAFPDPAAAGVGFAGVRLYSTSSSGYNIPTAGWNVGTNSVSSHGEALTTLPANVPVGGTWAPTVAYISGEYVMWFVGTQKTAGYGANLYVATSASPSGPFAVQYDYYDNNNLAYGLLDPYLWQDHSGNWWLFATQEDGPSNCSNQTSINYIWSQELTSTGLGFSGNSNILVNYGNIYSAIGGNPCPNSQIENPAFVTDPRGTYPYNLTMSYGTWNANNGYETTIIACDTPAGACGWNTSEMTAFPGQVTGGNSSIQNAGGASFVTQSPQWGELYMPFAAAAAGSGTPGPRQLYWDQTNSEIMTAGQELIAGNPDTGVSYCNCLPDGWRLAMQRDANLVLSNASNVAKWTSGTNGGDANAFAVMQGDGNFVVYDDGKALWNSGTEGNPGAFLRFQNSDGNLVVSSADGTRALWTSGT
jgi:hypothetical protein